MDALDVVIFGENFRDKPTLQALLEQGKISAKFIDGSHYLSVGTSMPPGLSLFVLGQDFIADQASQTLLTNALESREGGIRLCLVAANNELTNTPLVSCFDDFLFWPCCNWEFQMRLRRLRQLQPPRQPQALTATALEHFSAMDLVGQSPIFLGVLELVQKIALCNATALIEGETGTGKENVARAIHYLSGRREHGFVPVNCGAIPDDLLESQLFGHSRGAFTDAKSDQAGLVELAQGGTLFLDEVDSLSAKAQAALLRFLQTHEYRPLGSRKLKQADVRIVAATNANLAAQVQRGCFRDDLRFRLNVLTVPIPPLRQRREDIAQIATRLLQRFARDHNSPLKHLHPRALKWLKQQAWPGNVRELENLLLREFLLTEGPLISCQTHATPPCEASAVASFNSAKMAAIHAFEQDYVKTVLEMAGGNVTAAAKIAGKERRALGKLIKKYDIDTGHYKSQVAL